MLDAIALFIGITAIVTFAYSLTQQARPPQIIQVQIDPEPRQVGSGWASLIFIALSLLLLLRPQ